MGTQLVLSFAKRLFFNLSNALNPTPNSQTIRILSPYRNISLFSFVFILTSDYIKSQLGYDLENADPETTYCHPAKVVGEIMGLVGKQYRKREGEVKSLVSCLTKDHYEELMNSDACSTFTSYAKELLEDTEIYQ